MTFPLLHSIALLQAPTLASLARGHKGRYACGCVLTHFTFLNCVDTVYRRSCGKCLPPVKVAHVPGGVAERSKALVLKTREGRPSRGSNPRPSATCARHEKVHSDGDDGVWPDSAMSHWRLEVIGERRRAAGAFRRSARSSATPCASPAGSDARNMSSTRAKSPVRSQVGGDTGGRLAPLHCCNDEPRDADALRQRRLG